MAHPSIVTADEWNALRQELLVAEKQATRALDQVAAARRRMPMVPFRAETVFATPDGPRTLLDLFEGRDELVVYQFMNVGPDSFCPGCTHFTGNVPPYALTELASAGVSYWTVSDMPLAQLQGYWADKGWSTPFASSQDNDFGEQTGVGGGFQLNVFLRIGDDVFRTYATSQRGVDRLVFTNNIQDLLPFGRREEWEDSPVGWPQAPTYG